MIYEFRREDEEVLERSFPMGECPSEITCEDGILAKRVFSAPALIIKGARLSDRSTKTREEVLHEAGELGMRDFVPMKSQTPEQQLRDLKKNKSMFKEQMAEGNEKTLKRQGERARASSGKSMTRASVERQLKKREARAREDFKSRSISL